MKTFAIAGVTTKNGVRTFHVGKNKQRVTTLAWHGHEDIVMYPLPVAMTKLEAWDWLQTQYPELLVGVKAPSDPAVRNAPKAKRDKSAATPAMTLDEALLLIPKRNDKGHFIKKEVREQMARELLEA